MHNEYVIYEVMCGPYYYVGSTKNSRKRKSCHLRLLKNGTHYNKKLQSIYNKYNSYEYKIIHTCKDQLDMELTEPKFIQTYKDIHKDMCANILIEYGGGSAWRRHKTPEELKAHDFNRLNLTPEQRLKRNEKHKETIKNTPKAERDERMKRIVQSCKDNIKNRKNYTPINITFVIPNKDEYSIIFNSESEFFETTQLEGSSLRQLKRDQIKVIKKRLHWTRHQYPVGTVLRLN